MEEEHRRPQWALFKDKLKLSGLIQLGGVLSGPLYGRCVTDLINDPSFDLTSLSIVSDFQEKSNLRVQYLFASPPYAPMRSISVIVSIVGILLAASSSAFSVSYVNIKFGGPK